MRKLLLLTAILLAVATATPAMARTFSFQVKNSSPDDIIRIKIRGGTIEGSTKVRAFQTVEFQVTLPDGVCKTDLRAESASGRYYSDGKFDFCKWNGVEYGPPAR